MDEPLPMTPTAADATDEKTNEFIHAEQGVKDDAMVLDQPVQERPVTLENLSARDLLPKDAKNPLAPDAQNPPSKDDENPLVVQNPSF